MVRKIGFGGEDNPPPKKSTADRVLDDFRARAKQNQIDEDAKDQSGDQIEKPVGVFERVFLAVWLLGWSVAIVAAFMALDSAEDLFEILFMTAWLCIAVIGWFAAARRLFRR